MQEQTQISSAITTHPGPHTVTIEKLVYGGDGLARLTEGEAAGKIVFVPWSTPGDKATITLLPDKKPTKGYINQLLKPGSDRVQPPCSVFGVCGGCHWQHVDYAAQLRWKQAIVQESLARIGKLTDVIVQPTLGNPDWQWHYRNKVQWVIEDRHPAYYQAETQDPVVFDQCHIIPDHFNPLATWLAPLPFDADKITVRANRQHQWLLIFHGKQLTPDHIPSAWLTDLQQQFPQIIGCLTSQDEANASLVFGEAKLTERIGEHSFQVSWDSFFQVNPPMAEVMLSLARSWLQPITPMGALGDLYAGVGLFAVGMADLARELLAVESNPSAVADARENFERQQIAQCRFIERPVEQSLSELPEEIDAVILDPPRNGCHARVLDWVAQHVQQQIIYVSCDPATLARDLKRLCDTGWQIQTVQPIDMFPQTYHIETLVQLVKPSPDKVSPPVVGG